MSDNIDIVVEAEGQLIENAVEESQEDENKDIDVDDA